MDRFLTPRALQGSAVKIYTLPALDYPNCRSQPDNHGAKGRISLNIRALGSVGSSNISCGFGQVASEQNTWGHVYTDTCSSLGAPPCRQ